MVDAYWYLGFLLICLCVNIIDLVDALSDIMNNQCREISKRVSQENQKNWMLNAYQVIDRMFTHWVCVC